jgi:tRNA-Thr(GGU) m(6)t(6)A37 methyltransferase TsaA
MVSAFGVLRLHITQLKSNNMEFTLQPIGIIHTPFTSPKATPIQPSHSQALGRVEVYDEFTQGLQDIDGFSHLILLYAFHRSSGYELTVTPFLDNQPRGLFATRYPHRPNPIGLSVVRLLRRNENELVVKGIDVLDGTPLIDIKPYVPDFDVRTNVQTGWYATRAYQEPVHREKSLTMKIAVITDDGKTISQHFGRAAHYLVFTVDDGAITEKELRDKLGHRQFVNESHDHDEDHNDPRGHGFGAHSDQKHARMIEAIQDCEAIIVRGMGRGAYLAMEQANIRPFVTDIENAEDAIQAYIDDTLKDHTEKLH